MRLLVVASLLYFAVVVTGNYSTKLSYPKFHLGKTHWYDVNINFTAKIPGFRPQVAKRILSFELKIHAETENNLIIAMQNTLDSKSYPKVGSDTDMIPTVWRRDLEESLFLPFKCIYKDGEVKSYYMNPNDSLETQQIRRAVLRNLEVYIDLKAIHSNDGESFPITYNVTKPSAVGNHSVHYVIISSPYNRVQDNSSVYNISRVDNYEVLPYPAYESHSNFMSQGCPKVCRRDNIENEFDAGCPVGYESYHTPMKKSYVQNYNLRAVQDGILLIDSIEASETHVADVYDQNMEISIKSSFQFRKINNMKLSQHKGQTEFKNLKNFTIEISEKEINKLCGSPNSKSAVDAAKNLLKEISEIVVKIDLDTVNSSMKVGEKLLLLKKFLNVLKEDDFRVIQEIIVDYDKLGNASEVDKVKRQIWVDILPLVGTTDSILFITNIIQENMNVLHKAISLWEASTILNALPSNILHVNDKIVHKLSKLLDLISNQNQPGYRIFFSATHIALARTINKMCSLRRSAKYKVETDPDLLNSIPQRFRALNGEVNSKQMTCQSLEVQGIFKSIVKDLETTTDKAKRAIYIETLSRTGLPEALPLLSLYVNGKIEDLESNFAEYLKVAAIKSLHALATSYPREVQLLVKPVFFNQSESFKVRIPAFAVLVRTNPSLGLLQQIVAETWRETSEEVGSYVLSALETYGNASLPCSQLLAHRIKKVLPQAKRFDLGYQRSKSLMWTIFDDIREFGLAKYLQYSASNESLIPNTIYGALEYNVDSFRDYLYQYSTHIQGISATSIYDLILYCLSIKTAEHIPNDTTRNLFKKVKLTDRESHLWRISLYHKLFYTVSYNYFDSEEANFEDALNIVRDHLIRHMKPDAQGDLEGRIVKLYMPSSFRASAVGQAFPTRIQFEMENPLLISLKFQLKLEMEPHTKYTFSVEPSIYAATLYSNQVLNLGDCRNVGVYYERTSVFSLPFEIQLSVVPNITKISYRFPHLTRKIFTYHSEAGTYAGSANLTNPPLKPYKIPIRTIPTFFKRERNCSVMGFPTFSASILTENLMEEKEEVPGGLKGDVNYIITKYLNSGWRSKYAEVKMIPIAGVWSDQTEMAISVSKSQKFTNQFTFQNTPVEQLIQELEIDTISERDTVKSIAQEGLILYNALEEGQLHIEDTWSVNISQTEKTKLLSWANFLGTHMYTLDYKLQHIQGHYSTKLYNMPKAIEGSVPCLIVFFGQPNLFRYDDGTYDKQEGIVICGINFHKSPPFEKLEWGIKAHMVYRPMNETLNKELSTPVDFNYFLPETHAECLRDQKVGKSASVACLKAFRERSTFNCLKWFKMVTYKKGKHLPLFNYMNQLGFPFNYIFQDRLGSLKGFLETNLSVNGVYIDKLTDKPVYDLVVNRNGQTTKHRFHSSFLTEPISGFERNIDTYLYKATNNSYPASCTLAEKYVLTYDLENYQLPDKNNSCTYLLSGHCVKNKKFAVIVSTDFKANKSKEVHLYIGNDTMVLTSDQDISFKVNFNGKDQTISPTTSVAFNEGDIVALYYLQSDEVKTNVLQVSALRAGLRIFYNGMNIQIRVSSRYKGELCGLCGDFDGDNHKDFKGLNGKFYDSTSEDFIQTFNLGNCTIKKPPIIKHRHVCGEDASMAGENQNSGCLASVAEPTKLIKRNLVLSRDDQFCFSLKPLPICEGNVQPSETEEEDVEFKCLPRSDPDTRNKVKEARVRILRELGDENSDWIETVSVARACSDVEE